MQMPVVVLEMVGPGCERGREQKGGHRLMFIAGERGGRWLGPTGIMCHGAHFLSNNSLKLYKLCA